jgi:hypothetical protein
MVKDYMRRLERQLSGLPPDVARDVASQVNEHIAAALSAIPDPSESDVRNVLQEVGSPESIAGAASQEFPSTHKVSFRALSFWGYALVFAAIWGYPGGSADTFAIVSTCVTALAGWALLFLRNHRISDRQLRSRINLSDLAVVAVALVFIAVLPSSLGMLKGPVLLVLFCSYYWWYQKKSPTLQAA